MLRANLPKTERTVNWNAVFITVLIVLPLFIAAFRLPAALSNFYPQGDMAVLEISTLHASAGSQLLGPYSRFHWNHPGPLYFYMLLPLYLISDRQSWSLVLSTILMNAASMIVILGLVSKRGGPILFRWTAILLAFYFLFLGKKFLSPWNPDVTLLPLAALFVLAAAACTGSFRSFLVGLFVGTFLVQTHIAYLPLVTTLLGLSAICHTVYILRSRKKSRTQKILVRAVVAILLLLVLWMPAIWEQIHHTPGNISRIVDFFSNRVGEHTFVESFLAVTSMMIPPFEIQTGFTFALFVPMCLVFSMVFLFFYSLRKNLRFNASLCMLSLVADLVMFWSVKRIVGGILSYLIRWVSMVALVNWISVGGVLWPRLIRSGYYSRYSRANGFVTANFVKKYGYYLLVLTLTAFNCWAMVETNLVRHEDVRIQPLFDDLKNYLEANEIQKPLLLITSRAQWGIAAGVILQLYKAKRPFAIQGWPTVFGDQFPRAGNEDAYLWLFSGVDLHRVLRLQIVNHLIAREQNFFIYEVPFSRLENSGLDKPADRKHRKSH